MVTLKSETGDARRDDICFIRFCAILLIVNSHLDSLYPIPQLGTGGALGNSLFFMMSGYGLALSAQRNPRPFFQWYGRRILRLYPSLILAVGVVQLWLGGGWKKWGLKDYFLSFVWPMDSYWFLTALVIFYVLFYVFLKIRSSRFYIVSILALFIPYFYYYFTNMDLSKYTIEGPGYFKWIFYFQIMLFGGFLAGRDIKGTKGMRYSFPALAGSIIIYYLILFMVGKGFGKIQFMSHLLMFSIVYLMTVFSRSSFVLDTVMSRKYLRFLITLVAGVTLEMYLLHGLVYSSPFVQSLIFPVNLAVFWVVTVFISLFFAKLAGFVRMMFQRI